MAIDVSSNGDEGSGAAWHGCSDCFSRMTWLNTPAAQWELWKLSQSNEEIEQRELADHGNLATRLARAPNETAVREHFRNAITRVMALVPCEMRTAIEQKVRSGLEIGFLLHGLEFARVRGGYAANWFNRDEQIAVADRRE